MDFESMVALKFMSKEALRPSELYEKMADFFDNPPKFSRVSGIVGALHEAKLTSRDRDFRYSASVSGEEMLADFEEGLRRFQEKFKEASTQE